MKKMFDNLGKDFIYGLLCGVVAIIVILLSWRILIPIVGIWIIIFILKTIKKRNN